MTDLQIENRLTALVKEERRITSEILTLINQADARKIYLERGFSSLFDWLTRSFGYSEAAAMRRIQAARLLISAPEAAEKLAQGQVNLTTLSRTQSILAAQEKISGEKVSSDRRAEVIEQIARKSTAEAERVLFEHFPQAANLSRATRQTVVSSDLTRLSLTLDKKCLDRLKRVRDLVSHVCPSGDLAEVIAFLANDYIKRKDPMETDTSKIKKQRAIVSAAAKRCGANLSANTKVEVLRKSAGRCTFRNHSTGETCGSAFQVQVDHIYPRSLGGENHVSNLRALCRQHNILVAEQALGYSRHS